MVSFTNLNTPNVCSLCGGEVEGDVRDHIKTDQHQKALREMLDSPLTEPDPRRNQGYKDQPERRHTGSLGGDKQ